MKIGILTSGGDCPGLNAVIRGAVLKGTIVVRHSSSSAFRDGWRGVVEGDFMPLTRHERRGPLQAGRHDPRHQPHQPVRGRARRRREHREDARWPTRHRRASSRSAARARSPRPTAHDEAASTSSACRRPSTTTCAPPTTRSASTPPCRSPPRRSTACAPPPTRTGAAWSLEVMGRHVGWIALHSGMAGRRPRDPHPRAAASIEQICELGRVEAHDRGRAPLVVVAEGFTLTTWTRRTRDKGLDAFNRPRLGGISELLAPEIEGSPASSPARPCSGHIQRGGAPSRLRPRARDPPRHGSRRRRRRRALGPMVALKGTDIVRVPFAEALGELNTVPQYRYEEAAALFG